MKRQIELGILAVALTAVLTGLALPSLARAEVRVNVSALEYNDTFTVVSVLAVANGGENPDLWDLTSVTVNGTSVTLGANVEEHSFALLHAHVWVVKVSGNLITATDGTQAVTAEIDLGDGTTAEDAASCGPGVKRLRITAICK